MAEQKTTRVSHYCLKEELGKGQFGVVYKAEDIETGAMRAVKQIAKDSLRQQSAKNELLREIEIMKSLNNENIVKLFDVLETARNHYLVIEFCSGGELTKMKGCGEEKTVYLVRQIINALKALKFNNVVHRDLKPANILLSDDTPSAVVKLADFGLARQISEETLAKTKKGTPFYMAPEVMSINIDSNERYTEKADIWSTGCIIFELITGVRPFNGSDFDDLYRNVMNSTPASILSNYPFSDSCRDLLTQIFKVNPAERIFFEQMCDHPFVYGILNAPPIVDISGIMSLSDSYELLSMEEAMNVAENLINVAEDHDHRFLFYMKACLLLKPFAKQIPRKFREVFEKARTSKNITSWESVTMTQAILKKAVELVKDSHSHAYKENLKLAASILSAIKPTPHVNALQHAIQGQLSS